MMNEKIKVISKEQNAYLKLRIVQDSNKRCAMQISPQSREDWEAVKPESYRELCEESADFELFVKLWSPVVSRGFIIPAE